MTWETSTIPALSSLALIWVPSSTSSRPVRPASGERMKQYSSCRRARSTVARSASAVARSDSKLARNCSYLSLLTKFLATSSA